MYTCSLRLQCTVNGDFPFSSAPAMAPAANSLQVTRKLLNPWASMLPLPAPCASMYIGALAPDVAAARFGISIVTLFSTIGTMPSSGSGAPASGTPNRCAIQGLGAGWLASLSTWSALATTLSGTAKVVVKAQKPPPSSTAPPVVISSVTPTLVSVVIRPLKTVSPKS